MPRREHPGERMYLKLTPLLSLFCTLCLALGFSCSLLAHDAGSDFEDGKRYLKSLDYDRALACFDRSVDADPTSAACHFWRGKCLSGLNRTQGACAEFRLAAMLGLDPELKNDCRRELARHKIKFPKETVNDTAAGSPASPVSPNMQNSPNSPGSPERRQPAGSDEAAEKKQKGERLFKLSSKKLDWNLQVSDKFLRSMKARTDNLEALARGRPWGLPRNMSREAAVDLSSVLQDGPAHFSASLTDEEKRLLSQSDVVLILDHSGSMRTMDCPSAGGLAEQRIAWCAWELESFAESLTAAFPHGFHFITFDARPDIYSITSATQLREILQSLRAGGGTDLSAALREAFRLHRAHWQQPLLIAIITDAEIEVQSCQQAIVSATRQFPLPNGVFISLLQVGCIAEVHTSDRLGCLDNLKARAGAAYDACTAVPFSKLRREGLGRDLLIGLRTNLPAGLLLRSRQ
jgi:Mg-chelatase subunit ChlD